jgi:hypothetical protein
MMARLPLGLALALLVACKADPPASVDANTNANTNANTKPPLPPKPVPETSTANPIVDPPKPPSMPAQDGFFMAEGAPPPRACKLAADCHGDTIPDLENPCCQEPTSLEAYSYAYRTWLNGWRKDSCAAITCPPPPNPAQPPACAFEVDCVAGSCVDACK